MQYISEDKERQQAIMEKVWWDGPVPTLGAGRDNLCDIKYVWIYWDVILSQHISPQIQDWKNPNVQQSAHAVIL
jgi:hypothetical protein